MYVKKTYDMGRVRMIERYYPGNYGAPGMKRRPKRKLSPEAIEKNNAIQRARTVQRLILANFKDGDWHLILTYKPEERPGSMKEAKKRLQTFIQKMRGHLKKAGLAFKWIAITERGHKGACHHHMIIENIETDQISMTKLVQQCWPYGRKNYTPLYEEGEFEGLAEYFVKKETKEEAEGCMYSRSRNLIIPQPKREKVHHRRWKDEPRIPKGWFLVQDSLVNGYNPVTEYPYQRYTLRKLEPGGRAG